MYSIQERVSAEKAIKPLTNINGVTIVSQMILVLALAAGIFLRIWQINAMGYNSDEAVYSGQAAAIAGVPVLKEIFPIFRAHPLLFQILLSLVYKIEFNDLFGRLLAVAIGVVTILLTYQIGEMLYGRLPGALAATFVALMPYTVIVSRQVLLDGPMTFFATLTLYTLARFGKTQKGRWLYAAGVSMGLTFLSKETGIVMLGAIFAFLALASELRTRIRDVALAIALMVVVIAPFPIALMLAGSSSTGQNFLIWQLFRRPNHEWSFYLTNAMPAVGWLVIATALLGLIFLWYERSWREKLLFAWVIIPVIFFQIWPVKGFQYLLPIAPPLAVLAGRALGRFMLSARSDRSSLTLGNLVYQPVFNQLMMIAVIISLGWSSLRQIQPAVSTRFLAGTGGVPGGREAGSWIQANVPANAHMLAIGPSMANIIQFYGARSISGLSVSPNPLHRNPTYDPVNNPDLGIRSTNIQYLVWDSFSAARSPYFSDKLLGYGQKYNGRAIHTENIIVTDALGNPVLKPVIVIYEVHP